MCDSHECSLVRQRGDWSLIEHSAVAQARQALAEESRFTFALLDATTAFVLSVDMEGRVLRCNSACETLASLPKSQIEKRYLWESLDLDPRQVLDVIEDCEAAGGRYVFEARIRTKSGAEVLLDCVTSGVRDDTGRLSCLVITGQDITVHRQSEQRLRAAYELEHRIARTFQESLLRPLPEIPGVDFGVAYRPAIEAERVGGDFYDVFRLDGGRVGMVVGDVSGKGVKAAGLTETVRSMLRVLLSTGMPPSRALDQAGRVLLEQTQPEQFVTVGCAVLDPAANQIVYASAGHPFPVVAGATTRFVDVLQGVPLGAYACEYEDRLIRLGEGEIFLLYTDGLSDAREASSREFFSEGGLLQAISPVVSHPQEAVDLLMASVDAFTSGLVTDDIAVVALQLQA